MDGENEQLQAGNNQNVLLVQPHNPLNLRPPPPLSLDGNVAEKWRKWKKKFQIYMEATESSTKPDEAKIAILLYTIGDDAQETYETFEFTEEQNGNFEAVLEAFEAYCVPKKNESVCRYVFFQRAQEDDETFEEFVTELKRLSLDCSFGELKDSLIKANQQVLTLKNKNSVDSVKFSKKASNWNQQKRGQQQTSGNLGQQSRKGPDSDSSNMASNLQENKGKPQATHKGYQQQSSSTCTRCGYTRKPRNCPAFGKICKKCNKNTFSDENVNIISLRYVNLGIV